jgi:flavin reductase (DIM6/NTAB) family NADH-FMN oxidoreductase RutF
VSDPGCGDQQRFKAAARRFASGVTVVSTRMGDHLHGITASSFSSLSLEPLLVAVAIDERSRLVDYVEESRAFAISVLGRDQRVISQHFATARRELVRDWLDVTSTFSAATGAPILVGCIAYFDCKLHSMLPGGDHRILVGQVVATGDSDGEPLLYFEGDYHELAQAGSADADPGLEVAETMLDDELLSAQRAVEPSIAELAASAATSEDMTRMRLLLEEAGGVADDPRAFTELSVEFHVALADASSNRALLGLATSLRETQQALYEQHTDLVRAHDVLAAHEAILAAVVARDAKRAREAMEDHIADMQRHFGVSSPPDAQGGVRAIGRTSISARTSGSIAKPT